MLTRSEMQTPLRSRLPLFFRRSFEETWSSFEDTLVLTYLPSLLNPVCLMAETHLLCTSVVDLGNQVQQVNITFSRALI